MLELITQRDQPEVDLFLSLASESGGLFCFDRAELRL